MKFFKNVLVWILVTFSSVAMSSPNTLHAFDHPSAESLYAATAGEIVITFLSKSASYSNDLYLQGTSNKILNNQTAIVGQQFSLGSFEAGAELAFKMFVNTTGRSFYNGVASNNLDNILHAAYEVKPNNSVIVGFEDIFKGGDRDYDDLVFSLSNVSVGQYIPTPVPEPETYVMMAAGLLLLRAAKRRKA
jgi:hypothetical protein